MSQALRRERRSQVADAVADQTETQAEIADRYGISRPYVCQIARQAAATSRPRGRPVKRNVQIPGNTQRPHTQ